MSSLWPAAVVDRLAAQVVEDVAVAIGLRVGHRDAALGQVLHQVQVEGQLLGGEALEQRQHPLGLLAFLHGGQEVVGVLDAALDAAQLAELAQDQPLRQLARLLLRHFGEDRHPRLRVRS